MYLARCTPILIAFGAMAVIGLAQEPPTIPPGSSRVQTFGMVGIATGQNIRLNVLNPGILSLSSSPMACTAQLFLVTDQGNLVKRATVTLGPGKSYSLDVSRDMDVAAGQSRVEIRAVVSSLRVVTTSSSSALPEALFCPLIPTLEVFDRDTGRTVVFLTDPKTFISAPGMVGGGFAEN
jgi:hypothetical protein